MDLGTLIAAVTGTGAALGGFVAVKSGKLQSVAAINQVLDGRITTLEAELIKRDNMIAELKEQVASLTDLVTSKADVETLKAKVQEIKELLDRVASKLEA